MIPVALLLLQPPLFQPLPSTPVALRPAFQQRCTIDPQRVTSNGKPVDPSTVKVKQAEFTLTLAEGGVPLSLSPRNLAKERPGLVHLRDGVPRLVGDRVVIDIGYEHPLMSLPPKRPGGAPQNLGLVRTEGQVRVNVRTMSFELEQTLSVEMDLKTPAQSKQDLRLEAKGFCVERAIPHQG